MSPWRPQLYEQRGREQNVDPVTLARAIAIGEAIVQQHPELPPIFTLKHLASLTAVDYGLLRAVASRSLKNPYKVFRIRKRPSYPGEVRFRVICVPDPGLMQAQRWIAQNILSKGQPHSASVAYSEGSTIIAGAEPHCGCRWLIKLDMRNFFESINEIAAYRVFRSFGYQPLVAFELARLCTRLGSMSLVRSGLRWRAAPGHRRVITAYSGWRMGHLPQGAPTSPMLANLAVRDFDADVTGIARQEGLIYTRYADDLTFSTRDPGLDRKRASTIIGQIYAAMGRSGLSPNVTKTRVSSPGSRKIVLGLLVDGTRPRLTRDFKANMRQHLHYLLRNDVGPSRHARARGFASIAGLKHHVQGLAAFARQVEPDYGQRCRAAIKAVNWPI
jgi:retron-type reverse transcriptase